MKKIYSKNVDKVIESVEGIQRANPSPYFYAKLMHKMNMMEEKKSPSFLFQYKPALVIGVLIVIFGMNAFLLIKQTNHRHQSQRIVSSTASSVNDFSSEYNLNTTTVY
ncbi:MAG: hypothetical protein EAZ12_01980 [Sphingobacteriia bacterium]|nr:MAG: hypothetical protein EAZ12_01980 [Sphingobacteriia bacterium]